MRTMIKAVMLLCVLLLCNGMMAQQKKNTSKGYINGKFSIAAGKQVYFSRGNLQYQPSKKTWRFALQQYEMLNEDNPKALNDPKYQGWMDLFLWGYGDNPLINRDVVDCNHFVDYGTNAISNGGANEWRTLGESEWDCILFKRETPSGINFVKAKVNGVFGLIILPDDWKESYYKLNNINGSVGDGSSNTISKTEWTKLESKGAVFLPSPSGYVSRNNGSYFWSFTSPYSSASYWTTTQDRKFERFASVLYFSSNEDQVYLSRYMKLEYKPVRLVCPVK